MLLSPAGRLPSSPQLLWPGVALGLQEAAALTAALADAVGSAAGGGGAPAATSDSSSSRGGGIQVAWSVEKALRAFDKQQRPQASAFTQLAVTLLSTVKVLPVPILQEIPILVV